MRKQWTAEIVGKMHLHNITGKQLAKQIGWHPKYLSAVINGRVSPKGAEDKVKDALSVIVKAL